MADRIDSSDIIFYLKKKLLDKIVMITSSKEVLAHLDQGRPVFVGHFRSNTNLKYKYFSEIAKEFDDVDTLCAFGEAEVEEPVDSFTVYNADGLAFPYTGSGCVVVFSARRVGEGRDEGVHGDARASADHSLPHALEPVHLLLGP